MCEEKVGRDLAKVSIYSEQATVSVKVKSNAYTFVDLLASSGAWITLLDDDERLKYFFALRRNVWPVHRSQLDECCGTW